MSISVPLRKGNSMEKEVTKDWVELTPILLAPCTGCGALWQPDQTCPICNDVDLSDVNQKMVNQLEGEQKVITGGPHVRQV